MATKAMQDLMKSAQARVNAPVVQRQHRLTLDTSATIGGCCGLFDLCSDVDVLSLSMAAEPFIDWLGWEKSNVCEIRKNFITWVRASQHHCYALSLPSASRIS